MPPVLSLTDICIEIVGKHAERLQTLEGLDEHLCVRLFQLILAQGRLTPRVLGLFLQTRHSVLLEHIEALQIRDLPPVIIADTPNEWLGQRKRY